MTLFGIPVRIEPSFLFITALIGLQGGDIGSMVAWVVAVFIGVLVHEMGHALLMKYYGFEPYIVLHGFGGLAGREGNFGRTSIWREILISLAGPGAGFVLGLVVFVALLLAPAEVPQGIQMLMSNLLMVTIVWGILNLLPMMPLDGGNVSRLLFLRFAPARPRWSWYLSIVVAALSIGASLFVGMFFWAIISAFSIVQAVQEIRRLPETVSVRPVPQPAGRAVTFRRPTSKSAVVAPTNTPEDDPMQAARSAFIRSPDAETGERLVTAFVASRRFAGLAAIAAGPDGIVLSGAVLAAAASAALEAGVPRSAVDLGTLAHQRGAGVHASGVVARAHGRLGQNDDAARWVERALSDGWRDTESLRRAPELAALVDDPRWSAWVPNG